MQYIYMHTHICNIITIFIYFWVGVDQLSGSLNLFVESLLRSGTFAWLTLSREVLSSQTYLQTGNHYSVEILGWEEGGGEKMEGWGAEPRGCTAMGSCGRPRFWTEIGRVEGVVVGEEGAGTSSLRSLGGEGVGPLLRRYARGGAGSEPGQRSVPTASGLWLPRVPPPLPLVLVSAFWFCLPHCL